MIILMFTGKVLQLGSLLYLTSLTYIDFVPYVHCTLAMQTILLRRMVFCYISLGDPLGRDQALGDSERTCCI